MSESEVGKEKRRHPRFAVSQIIEISFSRETFFHAEGINISEGGMLCRSTYTVEPLTKVFFMLNLPIGGDNRIIKSEGTVIHTRRENDRTLFGVSFDCLGEGDVEILRRFLELLDDD